MEGEIKEKVHELKGKGKELKGKAKETEGKINEAKVNTTEKKDAFLDKIDEVEENAAEKKEIVFDKVDEAKVNTTEKKEVILDKVNDTKSKIQESEAKKSAEDLLNDVVDTIKQKQKEFGKTISSYNLTLQKPLTDIIETNDNILIKTDLPGLNKEDLEIDVGEDVIDIKAKFEEETTAEDVNFIQKERNYGEVVRSITLPTKIKYNEATATFKNSILTIKLPKIHKKSYKLDIT